MQKITLLFICCLSIFSTIYAQGSTEIYDFFPEMPSSLTNEQLVSLMKEENCLPDEYDYAFRASSFSECVLPIGKIETKKAIILIYGLVDSKSLKKNEYLSLSINRIAFHKKKNYEFAGSSNHYESMVGHDALYREGEITYDGTTITFILNSYSREGGKQESFQRVTYNIGKKGLEFHSREDKYYTK